MAGNISLTKIVFAGLIGTFFIGTLFGIYVEFLTLNGGTIEEPYNTVFQDIASQYDEFKVIADTSADQSLVKNILDFGKNVATGTINVFVVGLDAIGSLFSIIPIVGNVVSAISVAIPAFNAILGLFTIILGLYVAMRYIQSVTNKPDLP